LARIWLWRRSTTSSAKEKTMYHKLAAILALPTQTESVPGESATTDTDFGRHSLYMCGGVVAPGAQGDGMAVLGLLVAAWLLARFGRGRSARNQR
jgi:hypothetical protein